MGASRGKDRFDPAGKAIGFVHSVEEAGDGTRADGDMPSDFNVSCAQLPGQSRNLLARIWVLHKKERGRQELAKPAMQFDD